MLELKRTALKEFIDEHLATGTIHPSQSPISAGPIHKEGWLTLHGHTLSEVECHHAEGLVPNSSYQ
jgi:hypothetical protein